MKTSILIITLLAVASYLRAQTTYTNFSNFKTAVTTASAGDEIILAAGRYDAESITLKDINGTAENPIIIRAEEIGADTLDIETYFDFRKCSYITIQGFVINISENSTTFKLQASNNIRLTQNVLNGEKEPYYKEQEVGEPLERNSSVWISIQGLYNDSITRSHHNQIDHNLFKNKHTLGNMIRIDGTAELYVSQHDAIEYNYFYNMGPRATNEMEAVRIGWSEMSKSDGFTQVTNNLFEACNGDPEIISVKCNKNTISHNTFRRCQGTLSLRHGNESVIEGNFFLGEEAEGTGGIRIYGSDHIIINNYFQGLTGTKWDAPITLTEGDAEEESGGLSKHFRIERAFIANNTLINNTYGIEIGYDNNGKYSKPPRDVVMENNIIVGDNNSLVKYINEPANLTWTNNIALPSGTAILAEGVSFLASEVKVLNPLLEMDSLQVYFRATGTSPKTTPPTGTAAIVSHDIDGQIRNVATNYGADEFQSGNITYKPLNPSDVGPALGEYLSTTPSAISLLVSGGSKNISVFSNLNWLVSEEVDWLTIDPSSGSNNNYFSIISATENLSGTNRTAEVTVTSSNASQGNELVTKVLVTQAATAAPFLAISDSVLNFASSAENKMITVTSNSSWNVTSDKSWIELTPTQGINNGTFVLKVKENPNFNSRAGSVSITDGKALTKTISVLQNGANGSEIKLTIIDAVASTEQNEPGKENIAKNVFDGSVSNRWSGKGDDAFITLDMGHVNKVSFVKVGLYKGDKRNSYFDILTSMDGIDYKEGLMSITSELTTDDLVVFNFADTLARYVRIIGHGNSESDWNSFTEFELWGWKVAKDSTSSTQDKQIKSTINCIYPNPSNGNFNILDQTGASLKIFNVNGTIVHSQKIQKQNETIYSDLPVGLYWIVIQNKSDLISIKLVIK